MIIFGFIFGILLHIKGQAVRHYNGVYNGNDIPSLVQVQDMENHPSSKVFHWLLSD